jgi:hypothetical protein
VCLPEFFCLRRGMLLLSPFLSEFPRRSEQEELNPFPAARNQPSRAGATGPSLPAREQRAPLQVWQVRDTVRSGRRAGNREAQQGQGLGFRLVVDLREAQTRVWGPEGGWGLSGVCSERRPKGLPTAQMRLCFGWIAESGSRVLCPCYFLRRNCSP